ncbi:hypothetical protein AOCH_007155 [Aspergillus ochraceoroseus]|uniref:Uncharacterized protein n=1 Tax=Aspergillus ochraceoroseus TaxID=138278 RepID=A0A0F8XAX3_9EURO|nr:hypothetical protein AOCH_007155 [Aspergillus ochraceoroseus]
MSGPAEERWRGAARPYDPNRQSSRHPNPRNMSAHGGLRGGHQPSHAPNNTSNSTWGDARDPSSGLSQEPHIPVRGFNAAEAKAALKKGMLLPLWLLCPGGNIQTRPDPTRPSRISTINCVCVCVASKPFFYKLQAKDANHRASGPWGSKANAMANGKDFFLELRKQVTALRQGGNAAGG